MPAHVVPLPSTTATYNELLNWRDLRVGSRLLYRGVSVRSNPTIYVVIGVRDSKAWRWNFTSTTVAKSLLDNLRIKSLPPAPAETKIIGVPTVVYSVLWMLEEYPGK